jgi:hypothetical protein
MLGHNSPPPWIGKTGTATSVPGSFSPERRIHDSYLVGPDTEWIEELLGADEISPEDALSFYTGYQGCSPIEAVANLLVPKGVDPARIAILRGRGGWSGSILVPNAAGRYAPCRQRNTGHTRR